MDRLINYAGAIPLETDLLNTNKNTMIALGKLAGALFGSSTFVNGLTVSANSPAALNVVVSAGELYSLQNIDGTAYSSLPADTAHQIVKQGILLDATTLSTPAPNTAGQSINYLIQASFAEVDSSATVLPYYNSSNPSQAYSGPANAGTTNNTVRKNTILLSAKAGIAATTGSQTTPAADSGYVGIAVVTVAFGQATVTTANIAALGGTAFQASGAIAQTLFGGRKQTFTSNGSFTVPAGVTTVWGSGCAGGGGGGGGGASSGTTASAGGGGGGGAGQSIQRVAYSVTPGQVIPITIGGGGSAGAGGTGGLLGGTGGAGGNTVIGTLVTLTGGSGGVGGGGIANSAVGAPGGAGYPFGSYGDDGNTGSSSGSGASSPFGGGGGRVRGGAGASFVGNQAGGYGGGGSGGSGCYTAATVVGGAGGAGAPGIAIIEY